MKSAYSVLGVPGNALPEDIENAFARARATYTPERIAADARAADQLTEAMDAYKVLRDSESRAAHDRKLAKQLGAAKSQARPPIYYPAEPTSRTPSVIVVALLLITGLFAAGYYIERQRRAAEAANAVKVLETARQQAVAEGESRRVLALELGERARRDADAQARDSQFRRDTDVAIARAQSAQARQQAMQAQQSAAERREEERKESERRADEQRRVNEGQRRVAMDRQRIRELCYVNYRRYDC